jgi:SAM-dependent methyltransferase
VHFVKWLREGPSPYATSLAMIGAKPGQHVVVFGVGDGGLAAAVALVTGLNGRTLVVDSSADAIQRLDGAAAKAGALVESINGPLTTLPLESGTFDVAVLHHTMTAADPSAMIAEAARVLRDGGRMLVIEGEGRPGMFGRFRRPSGPGPSLGGDAVRDLLEGSGLRAARVLGESDGFVYVEGVKPRG